MTKLIAIHQVGHHGNSFANPGESFEVSDDEAKQLVASGAATAADAKHGEEADDQHAHGPAEPTANPDPEKPFDQMTRTELEDFATSIGMEGPFTSFDTKADLVAAIEAKQKEA